MRILLPLALGISLGSALFYGISSYFRMVPEVLIRQTSCLLCQNPLPIDSCAVPSQFMIHITLNGEKATFKEAYAEMEARLEEAEKAIEHYEKPEKIIITNQILRTSTGHRPASYQISKRYMMRTPDAVKLIMVNLLGIPDKLEATVARPPACFRIGELVKKSDETGCTIYPRSMLRLTYESKRSEEYVQSNVIGIYRDLESLNRHAYSAARKVGVNIIRQPDEYRMTDWKNWNDDKKFTYRTTNVYELSNPDLAEAMGDVLRKAGFNFQVETFIRSECQMPETMEEREG